MADLNIHEEIFGADKNYSWKVHLCPTNLHRTFYMIFPDLKTISKKSENVQSLSIVVVTQKTEHSMDGFSAEVEDERSLKTGKVVII